MMAIRKVKARVEQVSRRGRVRLFKNSWFDTPGLLGFDLEAGRVYSMVLDDTTGTITEIREMSHERDLDSIEMLQESEIERLRALLTVQRAFILQNTDLDEYDVYLAVQAGKGRIQLQSYLSDIDFVRLAQEKRTAEREARASMNSECKNPSLAAIIRKNHLMPDGSISAGKTEQYDALHEGYREVESYHGA